MSADFGSKSRPVDADSDAPAVREMERRLAKKEASNERKSWITLLVVIIVVLGAIAVGLRLIPIFLMQGFD